MSAVNQETFRLLLENHVRIVRDTLSYTEAVESAKSLVTEYSKRMKPAADLGDNCSFVGVLPPQTPWEEKEDLMAVRDQLVANLAPVLADWSFENEHEYAARVFDYANVLMAERARRPI